MKQETEWPGEWTKLIGQAVQRARKEAGGMSAAALSEKCEELGYLIPRNTITNLENGRKTSVPVHEIAVLARALEIPAVLLLYPIFDVESGPFVPKWNPPTFACLQGFTGETQDFSKTEDSQGWTLWLLRDAEDDVRMYRYWNHRMRLEQESESPNRGEVERLELRASAYADSAMGRLDQISRPLPLGLPFPDIADLRSAAEMYRHAQRERLREEDKSQMKDESDG